MGHKQIVTVITPVETRVVSRKTRLSVAPRLAVFEILKPGRTIRDPMAVFATILARAFIFRRTVFVSLSVRVERFVGHRHAVVLLLAIEVFVQKTTCH